MQIIRYSYFSDNLREIIDVCMMATVDYLFSSSDDDSKTNPDDDDWDSLSSETGPNQADSTTMISSTAGVSTAAGSSAPSITTISTKMKQLNKSEKKVLVNAVHQTNIEKLLNDILAQLGKQLHFTVFEERGRFLQTLSSSKDDLKLPQARSQGGFGGFGGFDQTPLSITYTRA